MRLGALRAEWVVWGAGAVAVLLVLNRITSGAVVTGAASTVARAPADAVIGGAEGLLGFPDPRSASSRTKCEQYTAEGRDFMASIYCPALTWGKGLFDGK